MPHFLLRFCSCQHIAELKKKKKKKKRKEKSKIKKNPGIPQNSKVNQKCPNLLHLAHATCSKCGTWPRRVPATHEPQCVTAVTPRSSESPRLRGFPRGTFRSAPWNFPPTEDPRRAVLHCTPRQCRTAHNTCISGTALDNKEIIIGNFQMPVVLAMVCLGQEQLEFYKLIKKPAAQAAGADPSR